MKIKKQLGISVLEFTMVVPVLLMFIILVSEVGVMFYSMNTLTKATQDAARYMSKEKVKFTDRKPIAENLIIYGDVTGTNPPLLPDGNTMTNTSITITGNHVSVVVSYQHDLFMGSVLGSLIGLSTGGQNGFGSTFQLGASSVMRFSE